MLHVDGSSHSSYLKDFIHRGCFLHRWWTVIDLCCLFILWSRLWLKFQDHYDFFNICQWFLCLLVFVPWFLCTSYCYFPVIFMYELLLFVLFFKYFSIFYHKRIFDRILCINDKICPVFSYVPVINICHVIFLYLFVINNCLVFFYSSLINICSFNKNNKYLLCISFISMSNCFCIFFLIFIGDINLSHLSVKFIVYI